MTEQSDNLLVARIRKDDDLLREHFSKIKKSDRVFEVRRLLEKAIKAEYKEQKNIELALKALKEKEE